MMQPAVLPKNAPKQFSNEIVCLDGSSSDNFEQLHKFLTENGLKVGIENSHPFHEPGFLCQARATHTTIGSALWLKHDGATLESSARLVMTSKVLRLTFVIAGEAVVLFRGKTLRLYAGDFLICEGEDALRVTNYEISETFHLLVSDNYFYTHSGFRSEGFLGLSFTNETPIQRFFSRQVSMIARGLASVEARDVANICDGIFCFLRPVLREKTRSSGFVNAMGHSSDVWRARALDVMEKHFRFSDLSLRQIADEVGITPRYLCLLFREVGTTPRKALQDLRLRRVAVQLVEEHMRTESIAAIALRNGFATASHLNRLFKARYLMTPGEWRKQAQTGISIVD